MNFSRFNLNMKSNWIILAIIFLGIISVSLIGNADIHEGNLKLEANLADSSRIELSDISIEEENSIYELIETRVAANSFIDKDISFDVISKILWATHGVTYENGDKTVHGLDVVTSATEKPRYTINPASYDRYIQVYYMDQNGSYVYMPEENVIELISEKNLIDSAGGTNRNAQFQIMLTIDREIYKFGNEWAYVAIGSSLQNVNLIANSEDVHVFTQGMFNDEMLSEELELKDSEEAIVLLSFGYIK